MVQDATIITSDPGKHGKKKTPVSPDMPEIVPDTKKDASAMSKEEKRDAKIRSAENKRLRREERRSAKTRRSKDGTWVKKGDRSYFGDKLHTVQGTDMPLIRDFVVTTASLHDSQVDPGIPGLPVYRD
ncbi:transposase IS4 family protein, partial [mine drainage metagenome]